MVKSAAVGLGVTKQVVLAGCRPGGEGGWEQVGGEHGALRRPQWTRPQGQNPYTGNKTVVAAHTRSGSISGATCTATE